MSIFKHAASEDVFRKNTQEISEEQKALVLQIKEEAEALYSSINFMLFNYGYEEASLALRKLEEAVMWATKAVTKRENVKFTEIQE
jgi:hypothetical protein